MSVVIHLQAAGDLFKRYVGVVTAAWRSRHQLDHQPYFPHEVEFLPAALSLQETPLSPAPRVAMWLIMAFSGIALAWSVIGKIDVTAIASGKIVPSDRSKVIQSIETATIKAIHVHDGQAVRIGQPLIDLDGTIAAADLARVSGDLAVYQLQVVRLKSFLSMMDAARTVAIEWPGGIPADRVEQERRTLDVQIAEYRAKIARIEADIARREAELRTVRELVRKVELTVPLARQRAEDYRGLVDKNFISKHGYFEKEQIRIEQEADLATQRSRVAELQAGINEGRSQLIAARAEARRQSLDALNEAQSRVAAVSQEGIKADARNRLMTITAPVDGTVQQLATHTVGGVVTPAQPIMVIVPNDDAIEIEAVIENKDIGFIYEGQVAAVKLETFLYTRYGTVPATVSHVSQDAVRDEKRGLIYTARIRLNKSSMVIDGREVRLVPGMAATVEIKTGQRQIIEYILSPFERHVSEAGRER